MSRVVVACVLFVVACGLPKTPPQAPARHTQLGLSIQSMTLGNGLRVVLVEDPHASEVQVTMRYRVGAGDDLEHPGIAHLVEHLMFQQTLGSQTLMAHLDEIATFANAFTSYDATTYVSRARPEMLDKLLSIEAVRLGFRCTSISDSAFLREREVVTQEIRLRDDDSELIAAVHAAVFPEGHPYRQAIGGTVDSVSAITRDEACAFADAHYAPGNAALVISGAVKAQTVQAALAKFLARVARRVGAAPNVVAAARAMPAREAPAPIDDKLLLVTWPLPTAPQAQLTVRTVARAAASAVDQAVKGRVTAVSLGDVRAPVVGFAIEPRGGETIAQVTATVEETLNRLPIDLGNRLIPPQAYEAVRQRMIYAQYSSLEDGSSRDFALAEHVLAGRDPADALAAEFKALRGFGRVEAASVAKQYLGFDRATVVTLVPREAEKRGRSFALREPTHDMGQRRNIPDPARARAPDTTARIPTAPIETRVLPNGLKVVLMPLSTVPTVDIRLVFGAGSALDPASKGGTALLAGYGLTWDLRHANDLLSFMIAGGEIDTEVTRERTSFVVRGVDMHIDYLLAGLKRWAVDGRYDDSSETVAEAVKRARKHIDDDDAISEAFGAALYGAQHPYARATALRYLSPSLTVEDAEAFRRAYFTPDNATLVIAGRVDTAVANRWVDFLFTDWKGVADKHEIPSPSHEPISLARHEALSQMLLLAALPARAAPRAQLLVTAAMLDDISMDVRHQLGAAYAFNASLQESRLASTFVIEGWIDAGRARDVLQLLQERVAKLRDDPDEAARAFVVARTRVVTKLASMTGSASALAARAEADIALGRPPLSDLQTAREVQALTIDKLAPILAELDLSRAAMLVRGPEEPVMSAYALLGRQATLVRADAAAADDLDDPNDPRTAQRDRANRVQRVRFSDLEDSLTDQSLAPMPPLEINVQLTLATSNTSNLIPPTQIVPVETGGAGFNLVGEVGYRFARRFSAGLGASIGRQSASYGKKQAGVVYETVPYTIIPVDLGLFAHTRPFDRVWAGFLVGVHYDQTRFAEEHAWHRGLGLNVELGYDVAHVGSHWLSVVARATASYGSEIGYGALAAGVAYRR
jgi:zinc protease